MGAGIAGGAGTAPGAGAAGAVDGDNRLPIGHPDRFCAPAASGGLSTGNAPTRGISGVAAGAGSRPLNAGLCLRSLPDAADVVEEEVFVERDCVKAKGEICCSLFVKEKRGRESDKI